MQVAHLVKTKSLKSDGRVIKWINSLYEMGVNSEVFTLEDANIPKNYKEGTFNVSTTSLYSRKFFGKRKGYFLKIPEFTIRSLRFFKQSKSDIFVFHDVQHYLTLFWLCFFKKQNSKKKIVWDLHELPHGALGKFAATRKIIQYILSKVDLIVYTNEYRRQCILKIFPFKEGPFVILNNFPDKNYINAPLAALPPELSEWNGNKPYILWMGAGSESRNFMSVLQSFQAWKEHLNLVVMGSVTKDMKRHISMNKLENHVYEKFVNQDDIIKYVDNAFFSIVFYKQTSLNNTFCEPNRLYQLITRRIPVIVGNNPPLKSVVDQYGAGFVLHDDGSNSATLLEAIDQMMQENTIKEIVTNLHAYAFDEGMSWENQFSNVHGKLCLLR
jgi:hypothetical protein